MKLFELFGNDLKAKVSTGSNIQASVTSSDSRQSQFSCMDDTPIRKNQ